MNTDIVETSQFSGGGAVERRENRALSRQLSGMQRQMVMHSANIEQHAQVQSMKAQAVGYVGQQAMQSVAMLSQMEGQLGQAVPLAVTRLEGIADITAVGIAQIVADSARKLG